MVNCMRRALGLPHEFQGVIPESTISANVCAALTTRESALNWRGTDYGIAGQKQLRVYASLETYSSIDNAVWIAGTVQQYLVKIPTDSSRALDPEALRRGRSTSI